MITLFTAAQLYAKIQAWIDGTDRSLTLKQLNDLYLRIESLLIWADDTAPYGQNVRDMFTKLDHARDAILAEVCA